MIVVADTSPINYLILIEEISLLPQIYWHVVIPNAVYAELVNPIAPERVRSWMAQPPQWLEIRTPSGKPNDALAKLNVGEREAILLAVELGADQVVIDELQGRQEAERLGLRVTGTVGVLAEAAKLGLIDLKSTLTRLQQTSFYISPALLARVLSDRC